MAAVPPQALAEGSEGHLGQARKGDYDWAHLAMGYWPDRVREKCKTDKSLAIAHGLEDSLRRARSQAEEGAGQQKTEGDE